SARHRLEDYAGARWGWSDDDCDVDGEHRSCRGDERPVRSIPVDLFEAPRSRATLGSTVDNPLSVLDLTLRTREAVESKVRSVWVRGEISDFKRHRNGHWYFSLRDRAAQIPCVVWLADQYRMPAAPDD